MKKAILMLVIAAFGFTAQAQTNSGVKKGKAKTEKQKNHTMKDCCMMKDGKMMMMKGGKAMSMDKDMTMKNGTICKTTGECVTKDGRTISMKEGQCMDMNGKLNSGAHTMQHDKNGTAKASYSCPMHPNVKSDKPGKCPDCGMDLKKQ